MTNLLETTQANIKAFKDSSVGNVKLLEDSLDLAEKNPKLVSEKFYSYYSTIKDLFHLSPDEQAIIKTVNEKLGTKRGADTFLAHMQDKKDLILIHMRHIGKLDDPQNQAGMDNLTEMMNNAWEKRQAEPQWAPTDGDPIADTVIWGFVNDATDPETDIDFSLTHGIERTLTGYLPDVPYTQHKDWLLCALTDVIALKGLQRQGHEAHLLPLWSTKRPEGLSWISEHRLDTYKEIIQPKVEIK